MEVGRRLDGEPPGYELRRFQRGQARGLTKIVLSSSALAASPAKGLPSPRAFCSLTWKPAARASPAAKIRRRSEPGQRPADEEAPNAHPTTAHSARSL